MSGFIFTCPTTKLNVQHWPENDKDISENEYEGITCLACSRLHFINRKTGELPGKSGHLTPVPLVPIFRG